MSSALQVEQRAARRRRDGASFSRGSGRGVARKLLARLLLVVAVEMRVAERVDELADVEAALARDQMRQQRVARDVEGHAEEQIRRALIELARQPPVRDIELEQAMAGRQLHPLDVGHVPGRDDEPARIRIALDLGHQPGDLVVGLAVRACPGAPLLAVDGPEVAVLVGPLVPDARRRWP